MHSWDFLSCNATDFCEDCGHSSMVYAYEEYENGYTVVNFSNLIPCYGWKIFSGNLDHFLEWSQNVGEEEYLLSCGLTDINVVKDFYATMRAYVKDPLSAFEHNPTQEE